MKTNFLKTRLAFVAILAISFSNAQTTDPTDGVAQTDANGPSIRLIDNKGTIKYMQANNGITTITSTEAGNLTTTTWQLGGTLSENTYIDVDGNAFALDGLQLITDITTASTNADADLNNSDHDDDAAAGSTGWTVIIRDEDTGAFQKIRVSDLLQVISGHQIFDNGGTAAALGNNAVTDLPADISKVSVYRNGAKLLAGIDYTVTAGNWNIQNRSGAAAPADWTLDPTNDVIEVHWFK